MAGWRRAVDLAMTAEEIETLTALSRSRTEAARHVERAQMLLAYRQQRSFFAVGQRLAYSIRRSSAASSGHWRMARWRPSTTDRDRARSRRSRRKRKPGWYLWRAIRPRSTAIRTSCGRRGFWPVMRASADRRQGTNVSPIWSRARCARSSAKRTSSRTRCATTWNGATPSSSRRWRRFCVSTARSRS